MLEAHNATIAAGSTRSSEIPANGLLIAGVFTDPGMTGTSLTFYGASKTGGPYARVGDGAGNALTKTFAPGDYVPLDPAAFAGVNYLQVASGTAEPAARQLQFMVRAV